METYPASLPCPQSLTYTPTERRMSGTQERPRDSRALQIDESAIEQITFPPMNAEQYTTFRNWWSTDLVYGGATFVATWPGPRGEIALARKFLEQPRWNFIGGPAGGYWQITAVCEMRGRAPVTAAAAACVFLDTFSGASVAAELHSPDVAPVGFAYAQIGTGPNTTLETSGDGRLVGVDDGVSTAGVIDQSGSSPAPDLSVTIPYTVTTTLRPSATLNDSLVFVEFNDSADQLNTRIFVGIERSSLGAYELQVAAENYSEGTGDGYAFLYHSLADGAERSIVVSVTGTSFSVSIDGGAGIPAGTAGTESLPTAFNGLRFLVDTSTPFASDNSYIDSVSLCNA